MGLYTKIIDLQNLNRAWEKVKANCSAPGIDGVRVEEFDRNKKENLYQLHLELKENRYQPQPVKLIKINQNGKERTIGLLSVRDKIVQQSINLQFNKIYDDTLSEHAFAYRNGKSALHAISYLEEIVKNTKKDFWVLQLDIKDFFENINLEKLIDFIKRRVREQEVIDLVSLCIHMPCINTFGEVKERTEGVYQGAILSPVFSNIYMDDFDCFLGYKNMPYVRYSDDMIILGDEKEKLEQLKLEIEEFLRKINLCIKEEKTKLVPLQEGVVFLGYKLDDKGKSIPQKAENKLQEKLENIWFSKDISLEEKLNKGREVLGGWEQYYKQNREINDVIEYAIVLCNAAKREDNESINILKRIRKNYNNIYFENIKLFVEIWKMQNDKELELFEYEQYYQISQLEQEKMQNITEDVQEELLDNYRLLMVNQDKIYFTEIMQIYTDLHCYNKAKKISEYIVENNCEFFEEGASTNLEDSELGEGIEVELNEKEMSLYMERFLGREDIYAKATINLSGKYTYDLVRAPFSDQELREHLQGKSTFAGYIQRNNQTVKFMLFDLDISKKNLLEIGDNKELFQQYLNKVKNKVQEILQILARFGIKGYVEFSGYRGYHIWVFFSEWISVRYVNLLQDVVLSKAYNEEIDGINLECFPNKTKVKESQLGQMIKLPWGTHYVTGNRSLFVDNQFSLIKNQTEMLGTVSEYDCSTIKRIIAMNSNEQFQRKHEIVERDCAELGELPEMVSVVLNNCGLQRYLCLKAKRAGYLSHFERLTILYVFGHLGDVGKEFVHTVMSFTLNYQYAITERYINKLPEKPISCIKLREQYKQVTAEVGCNCTFKRTRDCYPSPVLHAVKELGVGDTQITIPTTKKVTKEKEQKIYQELNIHKRTEELVEKLIELKKQSRGVEKAIKKQEEELGNIFDQLKVESFELEIGFLMRKKTEKGIEWVIEL